MKDRFSIVLSVLTVLFLPAFTTAEQAWMDASLPAEERAELLLKEMTVEEKAGQMVQAERRAIAPAALKKNLVGSVLSGGGSVPWPNSREGWLELYKGFQEQALKTRLGIPMIYGVDAVHGHNNVRGAVIFPHNIGLGAARDPELMREIGRITAYEVRATGVDWTFSPCVAVARDERWGRTYESFGEHPELAALLTAPYIEGLQEGEHGIMACAKHYLGDGGTVFGTGRNDYALDQGDTRCSLEELKRIHLAGYLEAVKADAATVMVSFSSWDGKPMHSHRDLITGLLKEELGFRGFVVSDWEGHTTVSQDLAMAVYQCVNAGVDMFMAPFSWQELRDELVRQVKDGDIPVERMDDAVRRILSVKFRYGLFDDPFAKNDGALFGSDEHRRTARKAVRKTCVLLKNEGVLPLPRDGRYLVAGMSASNIGYQCGGWTISWLGEDGQSTPGTTVIDGIRELLDDGSVERYSGGKIGRDYDAAVIITGEEPYAEGVGDSGSLGLRDRHLKLARQCNELGIPVVVILLTGRPVIITKQLGYWDACIAGWLPGTEGAGIADMLFGDHEFTGKLPCSWPRSMTGIPVNVGDKDYDPLFPYGYGLMLGIE